jgi:hypothetical protein
MSAPLRAGRFRKRPVEISAIQWDGFDETLSAIRRDLGSVMPRTPLSGLRVLDVPTLEGTMTAKVGDWIVRGVAGEIYPVKPEIFEATYERLAWDPAENRSLEGGFEPSHTPSRSAWSRYRHGDDIVEARPYELGENMSDVHILEEARDEFATDLVHGLHPGGMIVREPRGGADLRWVDGWDFEDEYVEVRLAAWVVESTDGDEYWIVAPTEEEALEAYLRDAGAELTGAEIDALRAERRVKPIEPERELEISLLGDDTEMRTTEALRNMPSSELVIYDGAVGIRAPAREWAARASTPRVLMDPNASW